MRLKAYMRVIYAPPVRACAKPRCREPAQATVALRYDLREVAMFDLAAERDPNLIELCGEHADRLVPPLGWELLDGRELAGRPGALT